MASGKYFAKKKNEFQRILLLRQQHRGYFHNKTLDIWATSCPYKNALFFKLMLLFCIQSFSLGQKMNGWGLAAKKVECLIQKKCLKLNYSHAKSNLNTNRSYLSF